MLAIVFAPFLFGSASLMSSEIETPSLYNTGALPLTVGIPPRGLDPGGPAWQTEPWLAIEHRIIIDEHRIPAWDPYDGYGQPFAAAMQPQPYYPLTALLALHPSPRTYAWWVVARLFVAGWFAALFLRLFTSRTAAVIGGAATMLTGYLLLYDNMPHLSVEVMLPMVLWATELIVRRVTPARIAALACAVALVFLGGMPESALLALTVGALYALVRLFTARAAAPPAVVAALVASYALGTALSAIQLLPFLELMRHSFNTHDPKFVGGFVGLWADGNWRFGLFTQLVPRVFGGPWTSILANGSGHSGIRGFFGCATTFLGIVALAFALRRRSDVRSVILFFACVVAFVLLKRFGNPVVNWTGALPLFELVNYPKYGEAIAGIAAGILAGFGADALWKRLVGQRIVLGAFVTLLLVVTAFYLGTRDFIRPTVTGAFWYPLGIDIALVAILAAVACATIVLAASEPQRRRTAAVVLAAIVVLEPLAGYVVPTLWQNAPAAGESPYTGAPYLTWLDSHVVRNQERVFGVGSMLFPNWPGAYGFSDPRSINAIYPENYFHFIDAFVATSPPTSDDQFDRFTGVKPIDLAAPLVQRWLVLSSIGYIVADALTGSTLRSNALPLAYRSAGVAILRVPNPLPRVTLMHSVHGATSFGDAMRQLTAPGFDVRREAVIEGVPPAVDPPRVGDAVSVVATRSDEIVLDVTAASAGLLLQNDTYYPGWTAAVDGAPVPLLAADGIFRGVPVPAGRHRVTIAYRSSTEWAGTLVSLMALALLAVLAAMGPLRRRRSA
jgi:hypothetical protein